MTKRYDSLTEKQSVKTQHIYDVVTVTEIIVITVVKIDLSVVKIV